MKGILERALIVGCDAAQVLDEDCPRLLIFNGGADWPEEDQKRAARALGFADVDGDRHLCPKHFADGWDRAIDRTLKALDEQAVKP